ncbi:serine/threonine protein kinase [Rubripirellula amarantea]|uniref:mitogen-activated protein kinase kinase n=1 Tax=Rubripirellula amarantea TaxID=2527999 RepID=A0A5C5WSK2_9BACT|nr:serine/threonine-protein kinase [Rubripirellula amarantea]MDA8746504.1 serine/threonine protein kinase [Rubripirellula amarantea]TWT53125.1 Serine/threonine-protein kinase PK-1 [Rubripirellula amarantea]
MSKSRDFLGPYRLARLIRVGSTAEVWEAIEENSQERFALKVLKESLKANREEINLLKHEYTVAKDLASPRIIKVVEYREDSRPMLVLELFSELNMKQALRTGPESLAFMLDKIVEQSAEGLYYMHTKNWIHLDVKPDNFLVSREGVVKLIDFTISEKKKTGLGRMFHRVKLAKGTRSYMAPEQIRRKVCDERTDIYSFGCVLYELATGKVPYTGDTPNDLLNKHLSASVPSPIVHNDNVTREFADLVKSMMAKRPDDRPPSMWEFLKVFRGVEIFKKRPRAPEVSVFDNNSSIRAPDDMIRKGGPIDDQE